MKIVWHGHSCFKIIAQKNKDTKVSIVIDPFSKEIGLKLPKLEADILLITHDHSDHNNVKAVSGNPFFITGPGEYDVKGVFVQGFSAFHDDASGKDRGQTTIYKIEAEDISICHLGDLGQKELSPDQVEKINGIDILMVPIGGKYTISAKDALKIMSQIEPKIIIPMHYSLPKLKIKIAGIDEFLKTLGLKSIEPLPHLLIKKKDLSDEEAKVVVLKP